MRIPHLLSTTAAIVLIGGGIAAAQGTSSGEQQNGRAPAAQQHAPAEKVAPSMAQHPSKGRETTGQGSSMSQGGEHQERGSMSPNAEHQEHNATSRDHNGMKSEEKSGEKAEMKNGAKSNESTAEKSGEKTDMKNGANAKGENKSASDRNERTGRSTTGQGAAGSAKLSTEQRTKITTILHRHKAPAQHLNVSISVGTRIPERVHLYPLPTEVVDVYPEWRGYDYILVGDEILVIDPGSHEIVAILEA